LWASVSPDGTKVAYIRGDAMQLRVMSSGGTDDHPVLDAVSNPSPVWAPDGGALLIKHNGVVDIVPVTEGETAPAAFTSIPGSGDIGVVSWQGVP
jgi:Tol biopolymer transport system component